MKAASPACCGNWHLCCTVEDAFLAILCMPAEWLPPVGTRLADADKLKPQVGTVVLH